MARWHNQMRQRRLRRLPFRPSDSFKLADDWVWPCGRELQLAG
jgi:hypothetical protein